MIGMLVRLAKILKHVFKYLPLYLILWGFLKKLGKEVMKPFTGGRNDAKPSTHAHNDAIGEAKKQNEVIVSEKLAFKAPQEIRGVPLNPAETAKLVDGKVVYIADMTGDNGKKFSSYVKMNKEQGKLEFYSENPDKARQTAVQYSKPQTFILDPKQANSKKLKF